MRQFLDHRPRPELEFQDKIGTELQRFQKSQSAIANALGLTTSLKPEVSLTLELYEAERSGKKLTVTMLGLLDGIAPTTSLRYLDLLEKSGVLQKSAHKYDNRMRYVEITPSAKRAIDEAIQALED
ncbi:hypothetical protein INR77_07795 [Erythrobacter sp. SCSIO 43205]|uniref:hypothetical protein n=1 Tax=Erythrobacter sp. SCSIO 43205 TaxID=2779361 RepID=UPI001CA808EE|nr:hypothetical protein [Erythrobacter sp. SCSIO 43205]UAB79545.1 hypothetical protein INR77_07795 [Erythrobacter sp. SCSIO 43205]